MWQDFSTFAELFDEQTRDAASLQQLDNSVFDLMSQGYARSSKEVNDLLIYNRSLKNTDKGYRILANDTDCLEMLCKYKPSELLHKLIVNNKNIKKICLYTDGFSRAWDSFNIPEFDTLEKIVDYVEESGSQKYCDTFRNIEKTVQPIHPLFKMHDDLTFVILDFEKEDNEE